MQELKDVRFSRSSRCAHHHILTAAQEVDRPVLPGVREFQRRCERGEHTLSLRTKQRSVSRGF